MMGLRSKESLRASRTIDTSLELIPAPDIPIDQLMLAVENTRPYVRARLLRIGRLDDVEDVMQDVRVAAWEGLVKEQYRHIPETTFGGWVQGIAVHLCATHIRRVLAHPLLPLMEDPDGAMVSPVDLTTTESIERLAEQEWAGEIIAAVRKHVSAKKWDWAVECLTSPRLRHEPHHADWDERKRWEAVAIVRQMAVTVKAALEVDPVTLCDSPTTVATAVCCLPTPLLRVVAERLVLTGLSGADRTNALMQLATDTGASWRYLEGKIGHARRLYCAALEILEHAAAGHSKDSADSSEASLGSSALT
ncbi:RNA polymerase sigma factor [Arthrobacter sp. SDTb3-6]|uniref:RNA polymerase sigma factor n=1 Tax=Arthrobacter sp. SDTb3-6 TaxID=2713571 RepID=UPI00159E6379|nr:sigma factor [Arthrobacter sp. SDTb3-6]NVM97750.1 hypothetical protein [Arthrobacter sp. SDTb3-6]